MGMIVPKHLPCGTCWWMAYSHGLPSGRPCLFADGQHLIPYS